MPLPPPPPELVESEERRMPFGSGLLIALCFSVPVWTTALILFF